MFENIRTTFSNALVRRLAWNMPFHAEHHSYPAVPFHRLPDLHRLIAQYLTVTAPGYIDFNITYLSAMGDERKSVVQAVQSSGDMGRCAVTETRKDNRRTCA